MLANSLIVGNYGGLGDGKRCSMFDTTMSRGGDIVEKKGLAVKYELFELAMIVKQFELPQQGVSWVR